ncbi:hypothetical protein SNEBB_008487 [Seison nebaliae]|nr:hypothetical protein SNEBB_008487 [Seison nebaliae]
MTGRGEDEKNKEILKELSALCDNERKCVNVENLEDRLSQLKEERIKLNDELMEAIRSRMGDFYNHLTVVGQIEECLRHNFHSCSLTRQTLRETDESLVLSVFSLVNKFRKKNRILKIVEILRKFRQVHHRLENVDRLIEKEFYPMAIDELGELKNECEKLKEYFLVHQLLKRIEEKFEFLEERLCVKVKEIFFQQSMNDCLDFHYFSFIVTSYYRLGKICRLLEDLPLLFINSFRVSTNELFSNKKDDLDEIIRQLSINDYLNCLLNIGDRSHKVLYESFFISIWFSKQLDLKSSINIDPTDFGRIEELLKRVILRMLTETINFITRFFISTSAAYFLQFTAEQFILFIQLFNKLHLSFTVIQRHFDFNEVIPLLRELKGIVKKYSISFFKHYHQMRLDELKMFLENDFWQQCPLHEHFTIYDLKEFKRLHEISRSHHQTGEEIHFLYFFRKHFPNQFEDDDNSHLLFINDNRYIKKILKRYKKKLTNVESSWRIFYSFSPFSNKLFISLKKSSSVEQSTNPFDNMDDGENDMNDNDEQSSIDSTSSSSSSSFSLSSNEDNVSDLSIHPKEDERCRSIQFRDSRINSSTNTKDNDNIIVTNTTLNLIRLIGTYLQVATVFTDISFDVIVCICQLYDYYYFTVYSFFIRYIMTDTLAMSDFHQFDIMSNDTWYRIRSTIKRIEMNFIQLNLNIQMYMAKMNQGVVLNMRESGSNLSHRIVGTESLVFLASVFNSLIPQFQSLSERTSTFLQFYSSTTKEAEDMSRLTLAELTRYISAPDKPGLVSCLEYGKIAKQFQSIRWDMKEIESNHNNYIDKIINDVKRLIDVIAFINQTVVHVNEEKKQFLMYTLLFTLSRMLIQHYSQIRSCTGEGRALLQIDFQYLNNALISITSLKPIPYFDLVDMYIKIYYYPMPELTEWLTNSNFKRFFSDSQLISLISIMPHVSKQSRQHLLKLISSDKQFIPNNNNNNNNNNNVIPFDLSETKIDNDSVTSSSTSSSSISETNIHPPSSPSISVKNFTEIYKTSTTSLKKTLLNVNSAFNKSSENDRR